MRPSRNPSPIDEFHSSYLGRAVATDGDAAHRLGLAAAAGTGVAIAAAAAARVVFIFVVAAAGVAARREARMTEGGSRGEGKKVWKKKRSRKE